ncbi:efflux RND transporter periplasmic adaptor subunit [Marinobacter orientalis]|uniref:Efflux RND transporter periplasmic adaptor subunit n=1 Tax=Marinobacter orientalis TaxID=1928859 RepID=A0A7Y0NK92_9GAMM|nr:efflux RND transporter periplasmic adaptor subunit [Marinobacter orientalis]NMT62990.1 efflux RND transporter periplasmic adaptor subunit [Marinobacter orientalis]TGX51655.1 efflux RND transporter periplasmic adaptor subunit [Marinobacter orientalis]
MTANIRCQLLFSAFFLAVTGCSDPPPSNTTEAVGKVPVTVAEISEWKYPLTRQLPGVVRPGKRAILSTRIAGTLTSVTREPGDEVTTGELLATIDARDIEAAIAAAEEKIIAAEAAVRQARLDSDRLERLYQEDLIARVRTERARVRLEELEAQRQAAKSELEAQQTNLSYTRLTSPFDGVVAETLVDSGSFVGPGQPLIVLEDRQQLRIDVPVSSNQADSLVQGQTLSVVAGPGNGTYEARLVSIIPALDDKGTGQRLRLAIDTETAALAPGQVVSVVVPVADAKRRNRDTTWVALPQDALIRRGQLTGVLVVRSPGEQVSAEPAVVNLRWIKTATMPAIASDLIPVTQGLEVGDRVVLDPSADLQDGQPVIIENAGTVDGKK